MMKQIFAYFFFAAGSYGLEYLFVFFQVDFFVHIILLVIVHGQHIKDRCKAVEKTDNFCVAGSKKKTFIESDRIFNELLVIVLVNITALLVAGFLQKRQQFTAAFSETAYIISAEQQRQYSHVGFFNQFF